MQGFRGSQRPEKDPVDHFQRERAGRPRTRRGPYRPLPPAKFAYCAEAFKYAIMSFGILDAQKTIKVLHRGGGKAGGQILSKAVKTQAGRGKKNPQTVESADGDTVDNRFWGPKNRRRGARICFSASRRPRAEARAGRPGASPGALFPISSRGYPRLIHRGPTPESQAPQGVWELSTLSTAPTTITVYIYSATTLE